MPIPTIHTTAHHRKARRAPSESTGRVGTKNGMEIIEGNSTWQPQTDSREIGIRRPKHNLPEA